MTDVVYMIVGIVAILFVPAWALHALSQRRFWHCSECGTEFASEADALGHAEYHKRKHNIYQD